MSVVRLMSLRAIALGVVAAFPVLGLTACGGDETATPDECTDLPQYDIAEVDQQTGAVQLDQAVTDSPLSGSEQRALWTAEKRGCVNLPTKEYSLKGLKLQASDERLWGDQVEADESSADAPIDGE